MIDIVRAEPLHRAGWERLWRQNIANFGAADMTDHVIDVLWHRILDSDHAMQAWLAVDRRGEKDDPADDSAVVGLAHIIVHPHTFSLRNVGYLEDFWVPADQRGQGIGKQLIAALKIQAKQQDWVRLYWLTAGDNHNAQRLYDRLTQRVDAVLYKIDTV
ncbi:GNAT family N-acetyltransferase [Thalassospira sp.]|uniref:GNAT family N-acetyltransferase n=1 Tax=Thalassospira sp. TaxID=1912094 RepID=UPI002736AAB2|nr:GNAT family N-acetyltransferase [Thalassospira sp.]MDP2697507.1 GNAT family N-acetyltransferase [Thalassospira sp.]